MKIKLSCITVVCAMSLSMSAAADIVVGVSLAETGPGASIGIQAKNAFAILPDTMAGEKIRYVIMDDATDPTKAVRNARKLTTQDKVDVLIGSISVPTILAISEVAAETKTAQIGLSPITGAAAQNPWLFSVAQPTPII